MSACDLTIALCLPPRCLQCRAVAAAQPPPPGFARFPYGSCSKSSPYRTYEATFPQGQSGNVFCWTLQYQGGRCSDPGFQACCQNDVHKFSLAFGESGSDPVYRPNQPATSRFSFVNTL